MKKGIQHMMEPSNDEMNFSSGLGRRDFFRILGGGLLILLTPWPAGELEATPSGQRRQLPKDYNAFLHIGEDGTVTCYTGKIEMGQGINTALPVMMADELNVPVDKVKIVMGDTDLCPFDAGTWGSLSVRQFGPAMRAAAAEARGVLTLMAAEKFGVPKEQLEVRDGVVTDINNSKNKISYADLAKGKKIERFLDVKPAAEDYSRFTYIGKSYKRSDAFLKVTGKAEYTGDLRLPGMLYARILRAPSHGATRTSLNLAEAEKVEGVKIVVEDDLVAVVGENLERAGEALSKIKAEYKYDELMVNDKSLVDYMLKADSSSEKMDVKGNIDEGRKLSEFNFESQFSDPYLAHSPIETHTALARFEGGKVTVWASTQSPFGLKQSIVNQLKMTPENVRVITPFVGGGFGGKAPSQQGVEAARLAKLTGRPVMVVWTRDEEFFFDTFHPAGVIKINSGIDKDGLIKYWDYNVWFSGTRGAEPVYDIPNTITTSYDEKRDGPAVHPFGTGAWRAPNNNTNTFAREVQIDIMASRAGTDPLEFRLKNLKNRHIIDCLKAAADRFGYKPHKSPSGRGIGIACGTDAGAWVAHIAEVSVDKSTGKVKVLRMVVAQDMGLCVNPEGSLMQMEGCITMGLGYTFTEELKFEGGNIQDRGFDTYNIPRFSWLPKMECIILERNNEPPQGGGEPAIIGIGAVVANAVYDATGARLFTMPFTPERVLQALKKAPPLP
ncbi:MAG TPA: molybdopterin cofactor-binding domain-containing protein [Bacteroidales bacterium]|nr:molybdopterin cofactor-binding domain-containing protein [Bacteroidales bacterium]